MACIVLVELREWMNNPPIEEVASTLSTTKLFALSPSDLRKTLDTMVDAGSRYKNLELATNDGICFLLGTTLKES